MRRACDSCSIRKVKCDETGPPCKSCAVLDIPCTFDRPSRRRGPPNRHAEAIKKRRLDEQGGIASNEDATVNMDPSEGGVGFFVDVTPPSEPLSISLAASVRPHHGPSLAQQRLSLESLLSHDTVRNLVDDFFLYIHPLTPLPHEPSYRAAFARRDDLRDRSFLALTAQMIAFLVTCFPRRLRKRLSLEEKQRFPTSLALIRRCHTIRAQARGTAYLERDPGLNDLAISYLAAITAGYMLSMKDLRLYMSETMMLLRALNYHSPNAYRDKGVRVDHIAQQISRRVWYMCYTGWISIALLGMEGYIALPWSTPTERFPPLPEEVEDECITAAEIRAQPAGIVSKITGFNANVRIFKCVDPFIRMDNPLPAAQARSFTYHRKTIGHCLSDIISNVVNLAPEHQIKDKILSQPSTQTSDAAMRLHMSRMGAQFQSNGEARAFNAHSTGTTSSDGDQRDPRQIQHEIQKANIQMTQISLRSFLVEQYWTLRSELKDDTSMSSGGPSPSSYFEQGSQTPSGAYSTYTSPPVKTEAPSPGQGLAYSSTPHSSHSAAASPLDGPSRIAQLYNIPGNFIRPPDPTDESMSREREEVISDLLLLLRSLKRVDIEPNAVSVTQKIRSVSGSLLNMPRTSTGTLSARVDQVLHALLKILVKLDRTETRPKKRNAQVQEHNYQAPTPNSSANSQASYAASYSAPASLKRYAQDEPTTSPEFDAMSSSASASSEGAPQPNYVIYIPTLDEEEDEEEEEDLRNWAGLAEFQRKFVEEGGFSNC